MALAAVTASGCKADVTSEPETVAVIFEVNGTDGTLAAAADGDSIKSKGRVEKGKTAIFTAVPQSGYLPNAWTITGGKILAGGKQGDDGDNQQELGKGFFIRFGFGVEKVEFIDTVKGEADIFGFVASASAFDDVE